MYDVALHSDTQATALALVLTTKLKTNEKNTQKTNS